MAVKKKYEILNNCSTKENGHILRPICALRDFGKVKAGDWGGWIEHEGNLSHYGNCWICEGSKVYGNARVYDNAIISGDVSIFDNALVCDQARVKGMGWIYGNARICGDECVFANSYDNEIFHNDEVCIRRRVLENVREAHKNDVGKPRVELIPPLALIEIGRVLEFGAKKYGANNWRNGMDWSRLQGAALRHLLAWFGGESKDAESDLSHLAHAACCLLFLMECEEKQIGRDDRPHKN